MPRNKHDTAPAAEIAKPAEWSDPDDAPELTEGWFEGAEYFEGNKFVSRGGRPKLEHPKEHVTVRLDHDIVAKLRQAGPGWQTQINRLLRTALELDRP